MDHPNFKDENYLRYEEELRVVNNIYNGRKTAKNLIRHYEKESDYTKQSRDYFATLDNYVYRTVDTIKNIVFRKPIDLTNVTNQNLESWLDSINFKLNINEFSKKTLVNRIRDRKSYILIDSPAYTSDQIQTKADQERNNIRPYLINISRSQVINKEYDNTDQLISISIAETYSEKVGMFGSEAKEQVKTYQLKDDKVELSIWREDKLFGDIKTIPNLTIIPIVEIGEDLSPELSDQAYENMKHLNRVSEKDNAVRLANNPIPLLWRQDNFNQDQGEKTLSITEGFSFNGAKSENDFEYRELQGTFYDIAIRDLADIESKMEKMSVEFVAQLKNTTATEVEKASTANESKLTDYATELEYGLNKALEIMGLFVVGGLGENTVEVNKDFQSNILSDSQFSMIMQLRTNGDISYNRLMSLLERGELLPLLDKKEKEKEEMNLRNEGSLTNG